jgi:hypothetical protein
MSFSSASFAQHDWEVGAMAGGGWYRNSSVSNPIGSASAGYNSNFAFGGLLGEDLYKYIGGEIRYMFVVGDPVLKFHGATARTSGYTNVVHYDVIIHTASRESDIRPFFALGAGVKVYSAPNLADPAQPLLNFAVLRHVNQTEALISAGGGVKYRLSHDVQLRVDFRAYMTPAPNVLFTPVHPSTINGWIYHFVPTVGVSYLF